MKPSEIRVGKTYRGGNQGHTRFVFRVDRGLGSSAKGNRGKGGSWVGFDTGKGNSCIGLNRYVSLKAFAAWAVQEVK